MDLTVKNWIVLLSCVLSCISIVESLECYTCVDQDGNRDKCIKTTKQCEEHQDRCITTIKWGLPRYWTPYGDRMHSVWKDCDRRSACEEKKSAMMSQCKRDWFDDWACIECCSGDMCNYYVTLGSGVVKSNFFLLVIAAGTVSFLRWIH